MRIVFIGSVKFSMLLLEELINCGANVVGICTKSQSEFNSDFVDLTPMANKHGIPCLSADSDINSDANVSWIKALKPDVVFCFGWSSLIKEKLLSLPRMGVIGYHPTLLPHNRGRHPLIWALALGLEKTGSTFFFMDKGADSGDILSQVEILISYEDDAGSLYEKAVQTACLQIKELFPSLVDGTFNKINQNHQCANLWRRRREHDGMIDFRMGSRAIYNLVRALTRPYVGAHLIYGSNMVKIWEGQGASL